MSAAALLQYGLMAGILILLLVGMVVAIGLSAHAGRNVQKSLFPWVFVAMGLGMIWTPIAGQRDLSTGALQFMVTAGEFGSALWLSRLLTLVVMFIVAARIIGWLYAENRRLHPGVWLYLALVLVLVTHNFIAGAFGTKPAFFHNSLYPLFLFTAAYFSAQYELERMLRFAKVTLFWFLLIGVIAAIVQPGIAIQRGYTGLIPGIAFRYWGLGIHANTVGPLALLFLLLTWHQPFARRALQWFAMSLGLASLILTQSKTAWAGGVVALSAMGFARLWPHVELAWRRGRLTPGVGLAFFATMVTFVAIFVLVLDPDTGRAWRSYTTTSAGAGLATLTGRVDIWALALEDWARNPLFGYGPKWGDLEYRMAVGNMAVVHAHNQFIHSLASAGLIGLLATVIYIGLSIRYAMRGFVLSGGLTAGLLGMVLVRAMTEVPLGINNWSGAEVFIQLVTFAVLLGYGARQARAAGNTHERPAASRALGAVSAVH